MSVAETVLWPTADHAFPPRNMNTSGNYVRSKGTASPSARVKVALVRAIEPLVKAGYWVYQRLAPDARGGDTLLRHEAVGGELNPGEVRKILVVRLDSIGDLLLSEPAIAALGRRFPGASIHLLASGSSSAVLSGNPHVDRVIYYEAPWHAAWRGARVSWPVEALRLWRLVTRLRKEEYDLGVELRGDFRDILLMAAVGVKMKVGSDVRGGGFLLDHQAAHDESAHQVSLALNIASAVGADPQPRPPMLYLGEEDRALATQLLPWGRSDLIAFHLGAGFPSKRLPLEKFIAAAAQLCGGHETKERRIVLVGGPDERALADAFKRDFRGSVLDMVGRLSVLQTAAVIERCSLFIGNDSAPMHLAAAVGTPVVTFFGPSETWRFHPYGVEYRLLEVDLTCRPCDYVHCIYREYLCMTRQSVEAIVEAAKESLSQGVGASLGKR
ncbi:MAG: hypothetical protein HW403_532 [Dehalococcoidia bacterium]|nr:hypothetical protein [Dehalococcoidia bacterium]